MSAPGDIARRKLERVQGGEDPRVLDLFSGCGGFSLGLVTAGCSPLGGIEADEPALRTYVDNLHGGGGRPELLVPRSVGGGDPEELAREVCGSDSPAELVDVLIGGPPCPTFSRIGRAKLNFRHGTRDGDSDEGWNPDGFLEDDRNELYLEMLRFVERLQPLVVLMENVPDFINQRGVNHAERACGLLGEMGYRATYTLLNSAAYGVPQWRERFFLLAVHEAVPGELPAWPLPARDTSSMPRGARNSLKAIISAARGGADQGSGQEMLPFQEGPASGHWSDPPPAGAAAPVSVHEAIGDLPGCDPYRDFSDLQPAYRRGLDRSSYPGLMRTWPGFERMERWIFPEHHVARITTPDTRRDQRIFRRMRTGDRYPDAIRIAAQELGLHLIQRSKEDGRIGEQEVHEALSTFVPPYPVDKFPDKWFRMIPGEPARTLTAHLGKDSYSHIHPEEARMITVQEAARLQSFPDGFRFSCAMSEAFRQIGNSVAPLVARALGEMVVGHLRRAAGS